MAPITPHQAAPPSLWNKKEAAEFYGVSERTIDRWLANGTLPRTAKVVIGGVVCFRTAVLLDHIAPPSDSPEVN
jgi:excisionase family DNA binding protein